MRVGLGVVAGEPSSDWPAAVLEHNENNFLAKIVTRAMMVKSSGDRSLVEMAGLMRRGDETGRILQGVALIALAEFARHQSARVPTWPGKTGKPRRRAIQARSAVDGPMRFARRWRRKRLKSRDSRPEMAPRRTHRPQARGLASSIRGGEANARRRVTAKAADAGSVRHPWASSRRAHCSRRRVGARSPPGADGTPSGEQNFLIWIVGLPVTH